MVRLRTPELLFILLLSGKAELHLQTETQVSLLMEEPFKTNLI